MSKLIDHDTGDWLDRWLDGCAVLVSRSERAEGPLPSTGGVGLGDELPVDGDAAHDLPVARGDDPRGA
jgi:hypothetical protein